MSDNPPSKSKEKKSTKSTSKKKKSTHELPIDTNTEQLSEGISSKSNEISKSPDDNNPITTPNNNNQYYDQIVIKNKSSPDRMNHHQYDHNPNVSIDKCDGCFEGEGICYCVTCGKIYCKICNEQIHIVPSNRSHERHPTSEIPHLRKLCFHHNNTLKFFCESCEEPICHDCQLIGPHNNKLHKIITIFDSFRKKFTYLSNVIKKSIAPKYDQTMTQVQYLEYLVDQVKNSKNSIEREIRSGYAEMIENLNSVEGKKIAVLNYESSLLQKDLTKLQEIITYVNDISNSESPDMISFLLRYKQINEMIEFAIAKPLKEKIDITLNDFPRQLDDNKAKLKQFSKIEKLLRVKDEIIWRIIIDKKKTDYFKEMSELKEKTKIEISEWAKLSDKYEMELQKYNLVCDFCGNFLDDHTVNTNCEKNTTMYGKGAFGIENAPVDLIGTKRHFFTQPSKDFESKIKKEIKSSNLNLNENSKVSYKEINIKDNSSNPFEANISDKDWVYQLSYRMTKEGLDVCGILNQFDTDMDGLLSLKELNNAMKKLSTGLIDVSQTEMDYLLTSLAIFNKDYININVFVDNLLKLSLDFS